MSKLTELIEELCPEGVGYKPLGDVVQIRNGKDWKSQAPGDIPVYGSGGRMQQSVAVASSEGPSVLLPRKGSLEVQYVEEPIWNVDTVFTTVCNAEVLNTRFFYFVMKTIDLGRISTSATRPSLTQSALRKLSIPVPPLEVQQEIVRVLDAFTDLEQSLVAELELRQKQFEEYRSTLLDNPEGAEYRPLGQMGSFIRGGGPQKKDFRSEGLPCIHYGQIYTYYGLFTTSTISYVDQEVFDKSRKAQPGNVIIAVTSENDEDLGNAVAWLGSQPAAVSNHTLIYETAMDAKYVSYYLRSLHFHRQKRRVTTGTKVRSISTKGLSRIVIPVPPLEVQQDIVTQLDAFEALIQSVEQEISLRRKQYEFYRDELLTFKSKEA